MKNILYIITLLLVLFSASPVAAQTGTTTYALLGSKLYASTFTPAGDVPAPIFTVQAFGSVPNGMRITILTDAAGAPGTRLATSEWVALPVQGESVAVDVPVVMRLRGGNTYWIAIEMTNEYCAVQVQDGGQIFLKSGPRPWELLEPQQSVWFAVRQGYPVYTPMFAY